jgi:alkylation response protein AidB-like acyl-CoA dehydrogenase
MIFEAAEDDGLIAEIAERFLKSWFTDHPRTELSGHDPALWAEFAQMGWLAMPLGEEFGGIAASALTLAALLEVIGKERVNEPYVPTVVHALSLLTEAQGEPSRALMAQVAGGEAIVAVVDRGMSANMTASGYRLSGEATLVQGGDCASVLLVAADLDGGKALFIVPVDAPGVEVRKVPTIDGSSMADVVLSSVGTGVEHVTQDHDLLERLAWARDRASAMMCADAVGAMRALLDRTIEYTHARHQFGKSLRSFQVIDHGIADMRIALDEARAATHLAIGKIDAPPTHRQRGLSAARVKVGAGGQNVAQMAVQFHGAMGVTEELDVGAYFKRLLAIDVTLGTRAAYVDEYIAVMRSGDASACLAEDDARGLAPDFGLSREGREFRAEIAAFLDVAVPGDIAVAQQLTTTVYPEADVAGRWQTIAHGRGVAAPNWPAEFGGPGWSPEQRYIWAHETARRFVPITSPIGLPLVGPVLMHYGTLAQQQRFLPPIIDGSELWCQGFSEPGAGSDLAALSTRAVRDGDDYVVTGSKMWTTHGHFAHFMAALVRTGIDGNKRAGISFLIIDMRSAGIEVRPIVTIGGDHEVNQVFLDDVRVPASNLVGKDGQGWEIAKFLLEYERGGDIMSAGHRALLNEIRDVAVARGAQSEDFWRTFAEVSIDIDTLEVMELRALFGATKDAATPSVIKLRASEIQQAVTHIGVELLGADLLRWDARRPLYHGNGARPEQAFASRYLNSRANTIFGGAREIQKSLIARAVG